VLGTRRGEVVKCVCGGGMVVWRGGFRGGRGGAGVRLGVEARDDGCSSGSRSVTGAGVDAEDSFPLSDLVMLDVDARSSTFGFRRS